MATQQHKRFSDLTWSDLPNTGVSMDIRGKHGWTGLHALACEAHERTSEFCSLTLDEWRVLIDACVGGLPVTLTWEYRLNSTDQIETTKATGIVNQIISLSPGVYNNVYFRRWGFSSHLTLASLKHAEVPPTEYNYRKKED